MEKITFLGPVGATFSHDAYSVLAETYGAPKINEENCIPANSNNEILKLILEHGGYGAIAMETLAGARVAEPVESFIDLLEKYKKIEDCPIHVVGAIRLKLHFCLMARLDSSSIAKILAHPKALEACKGRIKKIGIPTMGVASNGERARLVAEDDNNADHAALGPKSASEKYRLKVLEEEFEDKKAVTTFFLIAPVRHEKKIGKENRALITFKIPHRPGALIKALQPFDLMDLNLIQIHS
ncbi:MAG: Prephenate dehydratase, partial [Parcubacteria group bacterium]|nr:Prephenate dehydratase [Parcubacteria group bacterium]